MTSQQQAAAARAGYRVRLAEVGDAEQIARVHTQVWRETYRDLVAAEVLAPRLDVADATARWGLRLSETPPGTDPVWVGIDPDGEVIALGCAGAPRDAEAPAARELWAINVSASAQGTGLADLLMDRMVGQEPAYLWVMEGNDRAIAFYERHGFEQDGARQIDEEYGTVDVRMTRR